MDFYHNFLGVFGAFSAGIRGIFEEEVAKGCFQRLGEARQTFLRLIRANRVQRKGLTYKMLKIIYIL